MALHPALLPIVSDPKMTARAPPAHAPLWKIRAAADAAMHVGPRPAMAAIEETRIPAAPPVPVRIYRPDRSPAAPSVVFCHGGGFVWGSIETHDGICRRIAARTGASVISVGYRLSPEATYPAAEDDVTAVLRHIHERGSELRLDPDRVALCGDSAGGFLAVVATARLAAAGRRLSHLSLIYPALDPSCAGRSHAENAAGPILTHEAMRWFWSCHLPDGGGAVPRGAALASFPPTTILTAEHDPLRDEGLAFARALGEARAPVTQIAAAGMAHGFLSLPLDQEILDCWERRLFPSDFGAI